MKEPTRNTENRGTGRNKKSVAVFLTVVGLLAVGVVGTATAQTPVSSCTPTFQPLSSSGEYEITQDIEATGSCIGVTGDDITIDGNGHRINGTPGSSPVGIGLQSLFVGGEGPTNVTVRNVTVSNFETGVIARNAGGINLSGVTVYSTNTSVLVDNTSEVTVENGTYSDTDSGIRVNVSANVTVEDNHVQSTPILPIIDPFPDPTLPTGHNEPNSTGVLFTDTRDGEIMGNEIREFGGPGIVINSTEDEIDISPINLSSEISSSNEIVGNEITDNDEGIRVVGSTENNISDNNISSNAKEGVSILPGEGSSFGGRISTSSFHADSFDNVVSRNNVTDNGNAGIALAQTEALDTGGSVYQNKVSNNSLRRNKNGVTVSESSDNDIMDNLVENNSDNGIWILKISESNNISDNVLINNNDSGVYVGGVGGSTAPPTDSVLVNNSVLGSEYGIWIGNSVNTTSRYNRLVNNEEGIEVFGASQNNSFTNDTSRNNAEFDFRVTDSSTNTTVENLDIGESTAPDTTLSFGAENVTVRSVDSPPANPSLENISRFFNATAAGDGPFLNVTLGYDDSDLTGVNESTLRLTRNDGNGWTNISDSSLDESANTLSANITSFSDYGAHGEADGGSSGSLSSDNPFGDSNNDPVDRSTVINRIVEWNLNGTIDGTSYTRSEIINFIVEWNLAP